MPRRILVLGSTGFAGSHFVHAARSAGHEVVRAARRDREGDLACDVSDLRSVERAVVAAQPSAVVNLAGSSTVAGSWSHPDRAFAMNTLGALHVLLAVERSRPDAHILCVSSGEAYGQSALEQLPLREEQALRPLTPYGASKAAMEVLCDQRARVPGLRIAVMRSFNHIGPGQGEHFAASSFARQVARAELAGEPEVRLVTGMLSHQRDFTDIRDVVRAYLAVLEHDLAGTFNVCSGAPMIVEELVDRLRAATDLPIRHEVDPTLLRPNEMPVSYGSPDRLHEATGWSRRIGVERSVADVLDWWRERLRAGAAA